MIGEDDDEPITSFRVERQGDGSILLISSDDDTFELTEDDAVALARGLNAVALNNPPRLTVHLENDERSAHLEFNT